MKRASTEKLLKAVFILMLGVVTPVGVDSRDAFSKGEVLAINPLIRILRSTDNVVSNKAADALLSLKDNKSGYDLNLRSADLDSNQIESVAKAIKAVHENGGPALRSFSMSYNPKLGDEGVLTLVKNLPLTITEIGLVKSGLGDKGGEALISWATKAKQLRWLCVEGNVFSNELKDRFRELSKERNDLLVVF